jgi:NADPH-dependent ferric siderophore reductase
MNSVDQKEPKVLPNPTNYRAARVLRVRNITPGMRRLTLVVDDASRFDAHDLHVKLVIPGPGRSQTHPSSGHFAAHDPDVAVRTYTIRHVDVAAAEIDIDMVRHIDAGPGAQLADTATVGDAIGLIGPGGRNVNRADWTLLAGDETALPAIGRILEEMPRCAQGNAIIEIRDEAERQPLIAPVGVVVRWLIRSAAPSGRDMLLDAVCTTPVPTQGSVFAWAGAEFDTIQAIRAHWRSLGLGKDRQLAVAYWRRGHAMDTRPVIS